MFQPLVNILIVSTTKEMDIHIIYSDKTNCKLENPKVPSLNGSCGFDIVHVAYKTRQQQTTWDFEKNIKADHGIFTKSPSRK